MSVQWNSRNRVAIRLARAITYFSGQTNGVSFYNRISINERDTGQFVTAVGGAVVDAGTKEVSVSPGSVTFDVIEQPGEPVTTLSSPQLYINGTNSVTGECVYIIHNYDIYNAETATASIATPPGEYSFTASAVVNGTRSRFNSCSLSIGVPVGTPTGTDVEVVLQDENGDPSLVAITFDEVTTGGETTASVRSVGPAAHDGYTLLEIVDECQFLYLTSSAAFTSAEIRVSYDMDLLGIEASNESRLVFQVGIAMRRTTARGPCSRIAMSTRPTTHSVAPPRASASSASPCQINLT